MMILNILNYLPITDTTLIFFVVMLIILLAPIVMGKLRIPHIIGMVFAGMAVGPAGFHLLARDTSFELFGQVGLYYIMFLAALEMDSESMVRQKYRFLILSLLTFLLPFGAIYFTCNTLLGYAEGSALILSCIMASNTLIAYPIVGRYGLQRKPSVALSVGSSMICLLVSLVLLAIVLAAYTGNLSFWFWIQFISKFILLCAFLFWGIPKMTRKFLHKYSDAVMQFIFVMAMMFMSASLSQLLGYGGILGAFLSGLILNRYIPRVSPLMHRIEFIGNAIFIPYFLIGVGMLIDLRLVFRDITLFWVAVTITVVGTLGKALAGYGYAHFAKMLRSSGHMIFGLTSAHAAGAIAIAMVGMKIHAADGSSLVTDQMLNAIVIMILFSCLISTIITEKAAKEITLRDSQAPQEKQTNDDEQILIPLKYNEDVLPLIDLAMMMRNPKLNRGLVALNVVYDGNDLRRNQEQGYRILDLAAKHAAAANVNIQTQVRISANIANGIKHAFNEFHASEIILGTHAHDDHKKNFWGQFQKSLFNGLNRQIIMVRLTQPLNTIRAIHVAVPSRAQFETGFYRWIERIARMTKNLESKITFYGREDTIALIRAYNTNNHPHLRTEYQNMPHWNELPKLARIINPDHLFIIVTARQGTISYKNALEKLPLEITKYYQGTNLMIIFPDQYGLGQDNLTIAQPQHHEELSAYKDIWKWIEQIQHKK